MYDATGLRARAWTDFGVQDLGLWNSGYSTGNSGFGCFKQWMTRWQRLCTRARTCTQRFAGPRILGSGLGVFNCGFRICGFNRLGLGLSIWG